MKKIYVASDIHDDVEALDKFTDYVQSQDAHGIWILGDFSLKPYGAKDLERLRKTSDTSRFIEAKRVNNSEVLRNMKGVLDDSEIPYLVLPGNYDPNLTDIFGNRDHPARENNNYIIFTDLHYTKQEQEHYSTRELVGRPLVKMKLFKQFLDYRFKLDGKIKKDFLESFLEQPWVIENKEIKEFLLADPPAGNYKKIITFLSKMDNWLEEIGENKHLFKPFNSNSTDLKSLIFGFIIGQEYESEDGFADMDYYLNKKSKKHKKTSIKSNKQNNSSFDQFISWIDSATSDIYDEGIKKSINA